MSLQTNKQKTWL